MRKRKKKIIRIRLMCAQKVYISIKEALYKIIEEVKIIEISK